MATNYIYKQPDVERFDVNAAHRNPDFNRDVVEDRNPLANIDVQGGFQALRDHLAKDPVAPPAARRALDALDSGSQDPTHSLNLVLADDGLRKAFKSLLRWGEDRQLPSSAARLLRGLMLKAKQTVEQAEFAAATDTTPEPFKIEKARPKPPDRFSPFASRWGSEVPESARKRS